MNRALTLRIAIFFFCVFLFLNLSCHTPKLALILNKDKVRVIRDVRYFQGQSRDAERHSLDIFLPTSGANWPCVVVAHGGGWMVNSKEVIENLGYALANAGIAVVCANYRLYPRIQFPDNVKDIARATAWTKNNLDVYGANTENLYLIGYSAGALLTALVALDPQFLQAQAINPNHIKGVAVVSGVYDVGVIPLPFRTVFTDQPAVWRAASPINHIRADAPPFMILYAEHDIALSKTRSVRAQSHLFEKALRGKSVPVQIAEIPNCTHDGIMEQAGRDKKSETVRQILEFIITNSRALERQ